MLVTYCWIVYGQWPSQALDPETLAWAFPLAFALDLAWMVFCAQVDKKLEKRRERNEPWRYVRHD